MAAQNPTGSGRISSMYAVTITQPGGPEVLTWTEVPDPEPGQGEVLVDVAASAVNRADLLQRQGHYDPPPGASPYPGVECSGRIAALGAGVTGWSVGDEVCALLSGGGYAERVAVPEGQLLPVPLGVSVADAAALPEVAATVWANLVAVADLRHGETLLVHGGGSGVGTFAIQFASALGVTVLATARSAKHPALRKLGAHPIDYTEVDFVSAVQEATVGRGVDVILDIMGAAYLERNLRALAVDGRLVVIGMQGGRTGEVDLGLLMARRASITATALRSRSVAEKAAIMAGVRAEIWPLIEAGRIHPVIDRIVPMPEAAAAHALVAASDHVGKVLLAVP
jgi:putative PIG3 family NAD(P)H quinone oxidoreductase